MDTINSEAPTVEADASDDLRSQVIALLSEASSPVPRGELIRQLGRRRQVAFTAVNELIVEGAIVVRRGPRNRADLVLAQA